MKLVWTQRARADLLAIGDYIAEDNPHAARRWVEKLRDRAQKAAQMPGAGRMVPEVGSQDVREVFVRTYRIVYKVRQRQIDVLTVFEGRRIFPDDVVPPDND